MAIKRKNMKHLLLFILIAIFQLSFSQNNTNEKVCYQFKSDSEIQTAQLSITNNSVTGKIYVEYIETDDFDVSFIGTIQNDILIVKASYSNDAMGPYEETWKIAKDKSTITIAETTLKLINCNE